MNLKKNQKKVKDANCSAIDLVSRLNDLIETFGEENFDIAEASISDSNPLAVELSVSFGHFSKEEMSLIENLVEECGYYIDDDWNRHDTTTYDIQPV